MRKLLFKTLLVVSLSTTFFSCSKEKDTAEILQEKQKEKAEFNEDLSKDPRVIAVSVLASLATTLIDQIWD